MRVEKRFDSSAKPMMFLGFKNGPYKSCINIDIKSVATKHVTFHEMEFPAQAEDPGEESTSEESRNRDMMSESREEFLETDSVGKSGPDAFHSPLHSKESHMRFGILIRRCPGRYHNLLPVAIAKGSVLLLKDTCVMVE